MGSAQSLEKSAWEVGCFEGNASAAPSKSTTVSLLSDVYEWSHTDAQTRRLREIQVY